MPSIYLAGGRPEGKCRVQGDNSGQTFFHFSEIRKWYKKELIIDNLILNFSRNFPVTFL